MSQCSHTNLQRGTVVTVDLVLCAYCLRGEVATEAVSNACVLVDFDTEVIEDLVRAADLGGVGAAPPIIDQTQLNNLTYDLTYGPSGRLLHS